ncbi:UDP-N-acetylmuramoyl-L-alanyl-D-glutamate synthetase [Corynebacterium phocae]|uniref:UDP-N-acetylmuramoylalanine--D-glutamate ligase n=1 Tax=Corynebacterium phocae TaxID=161895 RepID=A0A1L7D291_9CORY|nr:UDP-N-acetylmuramoyl-L-alanine--D-glutamate ligase [Corynebacterium phocae]APT92228.1 UDP-N-acetylmuramoyl-L-alanyl-D-glutamate synthetase [Corynebacterium phocae]KAA8725806.1 UDP-N-acetylmuramoyl-L-alanine--D-glutamate ligase [Corynebacterium phocae]
MLLPPQFQGQILIAGAGISGRGCAQLLDSLGAMLTVADDNAANLANLPAGVATTPVANATAEVASFDLVVTSPGWRPDSPLLLAARAAGVEVIGDVELAYRLDRAEVFGPSRTWLVVTGTNGKTTTTGMLAAIMAADTPRTGKRALAVGNIGVSVFDALAHTDRVDILVAELSSFQLHWSSELSADVGVLLNLADDHLDWHGNFASYAEAKAKALCGAAAVIGSDDAHVREYADALRSNGHLAARTVSFTAGPPAAAATTAATATTVATTTTAATAVATEAGSGAASATTEAGAAAAATAVATEAVGVDAGQLVSTIGGHRQELCPVAGIEPAGVSGQLDAAAAAAAALLAGACPEAIAAGLATYRVAGHRGAVVHSEAGIDFVDNSKATNPHAADAALDGLDSVVWIAGGQLKGAEVEGLISAHAARLKAAVLLGVDRQILADALARLAPQVPVTVIDSTDPEAAMSLAVEAARRHAADGDTVLLAPAAASLDMYPSMAVRGDLFARLAREGANC